MTPERAGIHAKISAYLLMGLAFSLPFPITLSSIMILLLAVNWLAEGRHYQKFRITFVQPINVLFALFWLLHLVSAWLSSNDHEAYLIVERRLAFIAFPLLVFGARKSAIRNYYSILKAFVLGLLFSLGYCLLMALYRIEFEGLGQETLFYHELASAVRMNAVYLSAYTVMGIFISLHLLGKKELKLWAGVLQLLLLVVFVLLLSSKTMFVVLVIGLLIYAAKFFSARSGLAIAGTLILSLVLLYFFAPKLKERYAYEFSSDFQILKENKLRYDTHLTGTSLRLLFWKLSMDILDEQNAWFLGTGIGDFQDELNKKYTEKGLYMGNPVLRDTGYLGYNPHNEFVEITLAMGISALLLMLIILFMQFRKSLLENHSLFFQMLILVSMFCMTESVFSTNKGIVFYMFFSSLFLVVREGRSEKTRVEK